MFERRTAHDESERPAVAHFHFAVVPAVCSLFDDTGGGRKSIDE
jgi:hypothetical protein